MDDRDLLRYSRHILLDEIGIEGQEKLLSATVLAVGCGGLGAVGVERACGCKDVCENDQAADSNRAGKATVARYQP